MRMSVLGKKSGHQMQPYLRELSKCIYKMVWSQCVVDSASHEKVIHHFLIGIAMWIRKILVKAQRDPKKTLFMLKNWPEPKICQFDMIVLHCTERCFRLMHAKTRFHSQ